MAREPSSNPVSTLVVDESFAAEAEDFVDRMRMVSAPKYLAALADRWKKDPRPWARRQIFKYLAMPLDRPGHHPIVKRLFKQAEADRDDELMAAFMVAFDRLVRRQRRVRYTWDSRTRQSEQFEQLFNPRDQILAAANAREAMNPRTGERIVVRGPLRVPKGGRLFSYTTRYYLRRRAWRWFRRLGFQRPGDYILPISAALALYRDEDLAKGENILDSWSLAHIAFRTSPVLRFLRAKVEVTEGRSLAELSAAPQFEQLWKQPASVQPLLTLTTSAQSRLVRVWAMQLLKRHHLPTLATLSPEQLLTLLDHADEEVQQFGASLLGSLSGVGNWPVDTWLRLLETRSMTALASITAAMNQHVQPQRLDLAQCIVLACARPTPVARLGLSWLQGRAIGNDQELAMIARLAEAQCEATGGEVAAFALGILGAPGVYRTERVGQFFDSPNLQVRRGAWQWLTPQAAGYSDAALWSRLVETPYDDVRLRLIEELNQRAGKGSGATTLGPRDLTIVWANVLLGVHRGGRAKLKALRQISQAISERPDRAEELVPVLAVAIRSVRPAEARAGLSALLAAVSQRPEIQGLLARWIPELRLAPPGVVP